MLPMTDLTGKTVLLVVENLSVPCDPRVWREARTLREAGATVVVVCPQCGNECEPEVTIDGIHIYRYPLTFSNGTVMGYIREYLFALLWTVVYFHRIWRHYGRIDVVHVANPPDMFWPLGIYAQLLGAAFIFDEHDLSPETYLRQFEKSEQQPGALYHVQKWMQRMSHRVANAIISTNESYRAFAIAQNNANTDKTFVVRNGPDTRFFYAARPDPSLRMGRRFMAAYFGIMAIQDRVDYIIRAAAYLVSERGMNDFIIYLIGDGDDVERLKQLVHELALDDHILFTGRIPAADVRAREILSTADICLSPDPCTPLNHLCTANKIMDYMAIGKPIVSFDLKESRFSAGESALYVENNSPQAFADGMLALWTSPDRWASMSAYGQRRVKDALCWQQQAGNLLEVYSFVFGHTAGKSLNSRRRTSFLIEH